MKRIWFIFNLIVFSTVLISAQGTGTFIVEKGTNLDIKINSLDKYENGKEYPYFTVLKINMTGLNVGTTSWDLEINSAEIQFVGENGNNIPLDLLRFSCYDENDILIPGMDHLEMTNAPQKILQNEGVGLKTVKISYHLGTENGKLLLGKPSDFYTIDIEFNLIFN